MTIKTDITRKDFKAFSQHVAMGSDGGRYMYLALFGTGLVIAVVAGSTLAFTGVALHEISLMAGLFVGVSWLMIASRLIMRKMGPAADGFILGPRTISITDDGIRETSEKHESLFRWQSVRSADDEKEHVFVMVDRNAGIIVPRRAFASDVERGQFVAEIRRRSGKVPNEPAAQSEQEG